MFCHQITILMWRRLTGPVRRWCGSASTLCGTCHGWDPPPLRYVLEGKAIWTRYSINLLWLEMIRWCKYTLQPTTCAFVWSNEDKTPNFPLVRVASLKNRYFVESQFETGFVGSDRKLDSSLQTQTSSFIFCFASSA